MSNTNTYSNNKRIAKNTAFLTFRMVFVTLVYIYTSRVILYALGVVDYGIYSVVGGFVSMFSFINLSLANGIQRFYNYELGAKGPNAVTPVYNASLVIQGLLVLVVFILLESLGLWYLYSKMVIPVERFPIAFWLFQFSVISSLLSIIQIPFQAAIMSFEKMDFYAVVSIIEVLINLLIAFILPYVCSDRLLMFGLFTLCRALIVFFMYFIYSKKTIPALVSQGRPNKSLMKEMLTFSGWNLFGSFGGMAKDQGLNMILNLFFGPVVNAAKGIATQVSGAVQGFVANISIAVRPQLTGAYAAGSKERSFHMMFVLAKLSFVILYMLSLPLMIEIDYVLRIWLGNNVPQDTNSFIIIAILLNFLSGFSSSFSALIHSSGNLKWYQISGAICNIAVLPVAYTCLINGCSAVFAYSITIVFVILNLLITIILLHKIEKLSIAEFTRKVLGPISLVVITTIFLPLLPKHYMSEGFSRFVVVTLVSIISISISYYTIGADKSEKQMINDTVNKSVRKILKK